jgi:Mrp family chromosome partitioning ATPase
MTALDQAFIKAYTPASVMPQAMMQPAVSFVEPARDEVPDEPPARTREVQPPMPVDRFRPAYQVDQFAWSPTAGKLSLSAGLQLDRLADGLAAGLSEGRKVIGLGACSQGEGCTTLLLCAARRLAQHGLNVLMVDADVDHPCLARRLGLMPETGWEDVLAGRVPPAEAVIESIQDRLSILPLRGLSAEQDTPARLTVSPATSLAVLREHYELILVDLGELNNAMPAGQPLEAAAHWLDAVVLVHNVRTTPQAELMQTRDRLQMAGIAEAGIAENFV